MTWAKLPLCPGAGLVSAECGPLGIVFIMRILPFGTAIFLLITAAAGAQAQETEPQPAPETAPETAQEPPQETVTPTTSKPMTQEEARAQYARSMTYMLRRAKLVRTLAAEHLVHVAENAAKPDLHLVEEASQVVAYDLVCANGDFDPAALDQMATESTYRIAIEAGESPIAKTLTDLGREQSIQQRMDLLGDVSSTVFLFQVGRRRGLFDSLITDFGKEDFCSGMRTNMRQRYDSLTDGQDAEGAGE